MTFSSIPRPHLPTQPRILAYTEAESGVPDKELGHTIFISIIIVFISLLELDLFGKGTKNRKLNIRFIKSKLLNFAFFFFCHISEKNCSQSCREEA